MPTHKITLVDTSQNTYVLNPTTSPAAVTLSAQRSGGYFDYGSTFANVAKVVFEVDDDQAAVLTLNWAGASNPNWGMALVSGTTTCSVAVVGSSTKFSFALPATGQQSSFRLTPTGGNHDIDVVVQRK